MDRTIPSVLVGSRKSYSIGGCKKGKNRGMQKKDIEDYKLKAWPTTGLYLDFTDFVLHL